MSEPRSIRPESPGEIIRSLNEIADAYLELQERLTSDVNTADVLEYVEQIRSAVAGLRETIERDAL